MSTPAATTTTVQLHLGYVYAVTVNGRYRGAGRLERAEIILDNDPHDHGSGVLVFAGIRDDPTAEPADFPATISMVRDPRLAFSLAVEGTTGSIRNTRIWVADVQSSDKGGTLELALEHDAC